MKDTRVQASNCFDLGERIEDTYRNRTIDSELDQESVMLPIENDLLINYHNRDFKSGTSDFLLIF